MILNIRSKTIKSLLKKLDNSIVPFMHRFGHQIEKYLLSMVFIWFGSLKILGETSATSIVAKTIYWLEPSFVVPILGGWEVLIGISLINKNTLRLAVFLLLMRLPGSFLALFYHYDECFSGSFLLPTIQGQYLLKELTLIGAALVIGSTVKKKP